MMWSLLPNDIVENIVSKLPAKSLWRFRCVCKSWCNFISNPNFIKRHIDYGAENEKYLRLMLIRGFKIYSSIGYYDSSSLLTCFDQTVEFVLLRDCSEFQSRFDSVNIYGSCNGLLLIATPPSYCSNSLLSIWNTCTSEYKNIPEPPYYDDELDFYDDNYRLETGVLDVARGFGYHSKIDDYKIVNIRTHAASHIESGEIIYLGCDVHVYTLGTNSWKHIPSIFPHCIYSSVGVLVNGVLHWKATQWRRGIRGTHIIVSFDFEHDILVEVSPPAEHFHNELIISSTLGNLGGCLCLFGEPDRGCFEVWVMKDYGVRESWTKLFTFARQSLGKYSSECVQFFKTGEILFSIKRNERRNNLDRYALVLYDSKHETLRTLKIGGRDWSEVHTYVGSWEPSFT